ncbi:oxygen-independent coproporphyrinogen III oxidase [Oceanospirillum linum]|uniref:Coproporphyrinogen-III oxidase n=1 Tax=Oceanospirillum linum TaxID=966 RepID=A0A1T1H9S3_OCELI|nr:oxygen-independent coproporphyrinogen III oxidase [Oceanospirillum linum]OOV86592.1 oxygen-independent coproporphyrinogen III oxidase [Oceanospirillum linum]SEG28994.1 coproporphyrinogen III oxidase, anaerobic [Oleiphilus messinensis]SMP26644.1 coproporphyrinogen III oxidase, anaerobic [Oceanospirillum linum]
MKTRTQIQWDHDLIQRYNISGPRYTSYPTAVQFTDQFGETEYRAAAQRSIDANSPLSLYFHIPFCDTICFYCGCNKIATKDTAKAEPYLERVYKEIAMQATLADAGKRQVKQLHWGGGTPTFLSHDQMRELMAKTRQAFNLQDNDEGDFSIEIDPREATGDTMELLRELGFNRVSLGVQDFNPAVQKAVNRIQSEEMTQEILDHSRRLGFRSLNIDLIYGLPLQTVDTFSETLETIIRMSPDRISVFNYAHLPERFKPQRRIKDEEIPAPDVKLKILEHTINRLIEAGYVYIGMDHFAKADDSLSIAQREGKLHRNFQGYTTHSDCDLIAMGVSSISQLANTYSQNAYTINEYESAIDGGQLAVIKGLELTDDDILRRSVINQIICHFELDGDHFSRDFNIDFDNYFKEELKFLQQHHADGLIELSGNKLKVTPAGRLLVRAVCMAFDKYLDKKALTQSYSRII